MKKLIQIGQTLPKQGYQNGFTFQQSILVVFFKLSQ